MASLENDYSTKQRAPRQDSSLWPLPRLPVCKALDSPGPGRCFPAQAAVVKKSPGELLKPWPEPHPQTIKPEFLRLDFDTFVNLPK